MSNDFYTTVADVAPDTKVRSVDINNLDLSVDEAFGKLPSRQSLFSESVGYVVDTGVRNALSFTVPAPIIALADGMRFRVKLANVINGPATATVGDFGTFPIRKADGSNIAGEVAVGQVLDLTYMGGVLQANVGITLPVAATGLPITGGSMLGPFNTAKADPVASAAALDLQNTNGNLVHITGATDITSINLAPGATRTVVFDGVLTLTHSANLQLPGAANIVTAAGDRMTVVGDAPGVAIVTGYQRANGRAVIANASGGAAQAGNVTLTNVSAGAQVITPNAPGQYLTLPNATTVSTNAQLFTVKNAGDYDLGIKDATGKQLGWMRAGETCSIGCADNTSAAGIWIVDNVHKIGITARYLRLSALTVGTTNNLTIQRFALDATRTCFIFGDSTIYAQVFDAATGQFGAPTAIRSIASRQFVATMTGPNQILVASANGTALEVITLTIAGTGVTLNTAGKAAVTLAGSIQTITPMSILAVGGYYVVSYIRGASVSVGCMLFSLNGTAVAVVGAEWFTGSSGANIDLFALNATNFVIVWAASSTTTNVAVLTVGVGGVTMPISNTAQISSTSGRPRCMMLSTGRLLVLTAGSSQLIATLFTPTVNAPQVVFGTYTITSVASGSTAETVDVVALSGSKLLIASPSTSAAVVASIFQDNAGTITANSTIINLVVAEASGTPAPAIMNAINGATAVLYVGSANNAMSVTLDVSGTTPAVTAVNALNFATVDQSSPPTLARANSATMASKRDWSRNPAVLQADSAAYHAPPSIDQVSPRITPTTMSRVNPLAHYIQLTPNQSQTYPQTGIAGAAANESWFLMFNSNYFTIQRLEAVA